MKNQKSSKSQKSKPNETKKASTKLLSLLLKGISVICIIAAIFLKNYYIPLFVIGIGCIGIDSMLTQVESKK